MSAQRSMPEVKRSPLFEVTFGTSDGQARLNELLLAPGFEVARARAMQIADKHGLIVMGIARSPWWVITEFEKFE